jgi:hypothetical protein
MFGSIGPTDCRRNSGPVKNRDPDGGAKPSKPPGGEAAGSVRKDIKHRHVLPTVPAGPLWVLLIYLQYVAGGGKCRKRIPSGTNAAPRIRFIFNTVRF